MKKAAKHQSDGNAEQTSGRPRRFWVEKAVLRGDDFRATAGFPFGRFLISPQRSVSGADVYRFMREVCVGDTVLHLIDNQAFVGISEVESPPAEAHLSGEPWYVVRLTNYRELNPTLSKNVLFRAPFVASLMQLYKCGHRNLFFNRRPALMQGAYLTPAPDALVDIFRDAYRSVANGRDPLYE
jgi:hypothetical protein